MRLFSVFAMLFVFCGLSLAVGPGEATNKGTGPKAEPMGAPKKPTKGTVKATGQGRGKKPGNVPVPGQVIGSDDRTTLTSTSYPWSAIGRLQSDEGHCTGTLVGPDLVITNAHCVLDDDGDLVSGLVFRANYIWDRWALESKANRVWYGSPTSENDWALIRLRSPLGREQGWLGTKSVDIETMTGSAWEDMLVLAGYSGDWYNGSTAGVHHGCSVIGDAGEDGLKHNCDTFSGSSGSGLFSWFQDDDGVNPYIVALNWGHPRNSRSFNYGTPAHNFSSKISEWRSSDEGKSSYTYIHLCNRSGVSTISAAIAYYNDDEWTSEGWYNVENGTCREVQVKDDYEGDIYVHGSASGYTWGSGEYNFCVSSSRFTHHWADRSCPYGTKRRFSAALEAGPNRMNIFSFR